MRRPVELGVDAGPGLLAAGFADTDARGGVVALAVPLDTCRMVAGGDVGVTECTGSAIDVALATGAVGSGSTTGAEVAATGGGGSRDAAGRPVALGELSAPCTLGPVTRVG